MQRVIVDPFSASTFENISIIVNSSPSPSPLSKKKQQ
jgi:hypothetical protein